MSSDSLIGLGTGERTYGEGRYTPTRIGYEGAAFYRYRAVVGADVSSRIEVKPSWQWGLQNYEVEQWA